MEISNKTICYYFKKMDLQNNFYLIDPDLLFASFFSPHSDILISFLYTKIVLLKIFKGTWVFKPESWGWPSFAANSLHFV